MSALMVVSVNVTSCCVIIRELPFDTITLINNLVCSMLSVMSVLFLSVEGVVCLIGHTGAGFPRVC